MTLFADPKAAEVFACYQRRADEDAHRMRELGPEGYARRDEFLLAIGEDAGRFLHSLILAHRPQRILELGTSYGYSTMFLADAAKQVGATVVTMDVADYKQAHARSELEAAGLADAVEFRLGDARDLLAEDPGPWQFVLLDIWKNLYRPCFELFYPKLSEEGIICADNMIEPAQEREQVRLFRAAVAARPDLRSTLLPIGQGIELSVRWSRDNQKL